MDYNLKSVCCRESNNEKLALLTQKGNEVKSEHCDEMKKEMFVAGERESFSFLFDR